MNRTPKARLAAAATLASCLAAAAQQPVFAPPAHNWTLPLFTTEGYRQMTLRGDEVTPVSADRIDVQGMTVTVFSGTPSAKVDSVLMSPSATFLVNERVAKGEGAVRVVRDDIDVSGDGWTYLYDQKKVLISRHAHVVFHSALPDILKSDRTLLLAVALALAATPAVPAAEPQDTTIDCDGHAVSVSTDTETTTEFNDNVVAVGNDITLHCDYLKVIATRVGDKSATLGKYGRFKYMLATGHVKIDQGDRVATCGKAEVFPGEDRVVLTENPVVEIRSEGYKASGPRMILYRGQRRAVIEGMPGQPSHILLPPIKDLGFPSDKKPSN